MIIIYNKKILIFIKIIPISTREEAFNEVLERGGTCFDPKLVKIFIEKVLK